MFLLCSEGFPTEKAPEIAISLEGTNVVLYWDKHLESKHLIFKGAGGGFVAKIWRCREENC